jgi:hypothetical protein
LGEAATANGAHSSDQKNCVEQAQPIEMFVTGHKQDSPFDSSGEGNQYMLGKSSRSKQISGDN